MFNRQENPGEEDAMSSSSSSPARPKSSLGSQAESSVISAGLKIVGNLQSEADVMISGTVEGDINSRSLTVSEGATVVGTIESTSVEVRGRVDGQVNASSVKVARGGHVNGDILYETLSIDEGAVVEGQLRRNQGSMRASKPNVSTFIWIEYQNNQTGMLYFQLIQK